MCTNMDERGREREIKCVHVCVRACVRDFYWFVCLFVFVFFQMRLHVASCGRGEQPTAICCNRFSLSDEVFSNAAPKKVTNVYKYGREREGERDKVRACMCACVRACVCVCLRAYVRACVHVCVCVRACVRVRTYTFSFVLVCVCVCGCVYVCVYLCLCLCVLVVCYLCVAPTFSFK